VQRQGLSLWKEGRNPAVCLFCIHPFREETETLPDPKDMRVNRKCLSPQAKKEEAVKGLRADPFERANRFLNFFRIHPF